MMTNKAKKIFSCVAAISVLLTMLCSQGVYADNKNSTDTIGMVNSNVPYSSGRNKAKRFGKV